MSRPLLGVVLLVGGLLAAQPASAQGLSYDASGFWSVPDDGGLGDFVSTWSPEGLQRGTVGGSALVEQARGPLNGDGPDIWDGELLDLLGVHLQGQVGLGRRVALGLDAPVWRLRSAPEGHRGLALGDVRLWAPLSLLAPGERDLGLGVDVLPFADLPGAPAQGLLADRRLEGGAVLAVGFSAGVVQTAVNFGASFLGPEGEAGFEDPARLGQLMGSLGVALLASDEVAGRVEIRGERRYGGGGRPSASPVEVLLSARGHSGNLYWTSGLGFRMTEATGAARYRVFVGLGHRWGRDWYRYRGWEPDTDADGIVDRLDTCITRREVVNGWYDQDGCPDSLAHATVVVEGGGRRQHAARLIVDGHLVQGPDEHGIWDLGQRMPGTELEVVATHAGFTPAAPLLVVLKEGDERFTVELEPLSLP